MTRRIALCLLLAFAPVTACADEVDDYIAARMKKDGIPGLSIAVVKDGKVVKTKGYGLANVELKAQATEATIYELGSITKQFTATAVMMLVEAGKIGLDDPIEKYLPDLPKDWRTVTVRRLLNHTSGIPSYTSATDFITLARTDHTPDQIIKLVAEKKMDFDPGEKWSYNNTGYYLLGMLVEKAAGQSFPSFLKDKIFEPLGMTVTRPSQPRAIVPNRAAGYGRVLGGLNNRDPITPGAAFSAGFLLSDVADMARWDDALRQGKLLSASSYEQMYRPAELTSKDKEKKTYPYGFGWGLGSRLGHKVIAHGGGTAGFSTEIRRFVDDGLTVIVLTNLSGTDAGGIAQGVARLYIPGLSLERAVSKVDPDPKLGRRLKGLLVDTLADKIDPAEYTPDFAKFMTSLQVKAMTRSLRASGELADVGFLDSEAEGDGRVLRYKATIGRTYHLATFHLNGDGKVSGLRLEKDD